MGGLFTNTQAKEVYINTYVGGGGVRRRRRRREEEGGGGKRKRRKEALRSFHCLSGI